MDEVWFKRAVEGGYRSAEAATHDIDTKWAIEGLLTRAGSSVWFGPGATGKTQLLLQAAVTIAANGRGGPTEWLGGKVQREGQIVFLTAEDTRDDVWMRLGRLARAMFPGDTAAAEKVCGRIHVLPFLSMTEEDFPHEAPGIFNRESYGFWRPNRRMQAIRQFIEGWNEKHPPEDRICGVLMDSATSMSGFDTQDSDAVTNLMFYLNRLCVRSDIFWALIGHSQKEAKVDPERPRADAAGRLRGSGMWSTAPRMTVEVRLACDEEGKNGYRETREIRAARPDANASDLVVVDVAKSNVNTRDRGPRYLHRNEEGILNDITDAVSNARKAAQPVPANDDPGGSSVEERRTRAVARLIATLTRGTPNARVLRRDLQSALIEHRSSIDGLSSVDANTAEKDPKKGSLGWYCKILLEKGYLRQKGKSMFVVDLSWADRDGGNAVDARLTRTK